MLTAKILTCPVISASHPDEGYEIQSVDWFVGKFGNVHHKIFLALQVKSVKLCLKSFVQRDVIYDDIVFMIIKNYFAFLALRLYIRIKKNVIKSPPRMTVWIIIVDYFIQLSSQNVVKLLKGSVRILVYNSQLVRMKNEKLFGCSFIKTLLREQLNTQDTSDCVFSKSTSLQFGLIF